MLYLVGKVIFYPGAGDFPNVTEKPMFCFASLVEAENKYDELAKSDSSYEKAYLVEASPEGFKELRGSWDVYS